MTWRRKTGKRMRMEMKRMLVAVEVKEPTRKIHASVWRVVKRESET